MMKLIRYKKVRFVNFFGPTDNFDPVLAKIMQTCNLISHDGYKDCFEML